MLLLSIISLKYASWSVKSVCVPTSTFKLQSGRYGTISFEDWFDDSFDNSFHNSSTTAGEGNVCDALFEAVSSKFLSAGSFLLRGDVRIQGNTEDTTPSLNSFLPARDFLISPSLKCREHIFEYSVTLKCFP